ncbi:Heterogeneous nuclear ribonucleoprotein 27C [Nymphaea thermarum]|nr:Heterogeneous nuclear ribonucleoprotein 27C [Nymphaea thermarum]
MDRKLVVLGIPWDVNTEGLRQYMSKFGEIEDAIVMKERSTGRSRGFGYVTFASEEDAKNALESEHILGGRVLEVKIATPKEEMRSSLKRATRIFVARIPHSVTEEMFRSYFEKYGEITDLYIPKDQVSKGHRGIGFITFQTAGQFYHSSGPESRLKEQCYTVETLIRENQLILSWLKLMSWKVQQLSLIEQHQRQANSPFYDLCEEEFRYPSRVMQGGYGAYNAYITAATRYAALGAPTLYDNPGSSFGRGFSGSSRMGKKIFIGRLPQEANAEDLREYFGKFGRILDVYVPKDPKRTGHRGFGFVTFADDGVADRVARRSHEIHGQQVAIDSATPLDEGGASSSYMAEAMDQMRGYGGPMRGYSRLYGNVDFEDWGSYVTGGGGGVRSSRMDWRYRPY